MVLRQLHLLPPALVHDHSHTAGGKDGVGAGVERALLSLGDGVGKQEAI